MSFTSLFFIIFVVMVALIYFVIENNGKWIVLLVASIGFYITCGIEKTPFLLCDSLIAWAAGILMRRRYAECNLNVNGVQSEPSSKTIVRAKQFNKVVLIIAIIMLLSMLVYVKAGMSIIKAFTGEISIIVPLGISYYTFSLIGYLADVYWRKENAETNYFKLLLFTSYFPKIIQGPISKYRDLAPQLLEPHKYNYHKLCYGAQLMLWGYFKKLVIADRLAIFVNEVFGDYYHESGSMLLLAAAFGAVQLYCDFSGCMDIACGFSEIIGIKLEKNFNHPFYSESVAEFWRRWHITLGVWFKDYIYMPITVSPWMLKLMYKVKKRLGMSVAKNINTIISLSVVWMLTGLWHGTGINYVVWGIYWGILIICGLLISPYFLKITRVLHINTDSLEWHLFRKIRTFILFVISRVLTIPGDIKVSWEIYKKILFKFNLWELMDGTVYTQGLNGPNFIVAIIFLILLHMTSRYEENGGSCREWVANRQVVVRWALYYGLLFGVLFFGIYGPGYDSSGFIYMQY